MIAHVYHNGLHTVLSIATDDIEELIARCGWTVLEDAEYLTAKDKQQIEAIEQSGEARMPHRSSHDALHWWNERLVSETLALTPDI